MPLVINSPGGRQTDRHTYTHTHIHTDITDKSNFKEPGMRWLKAGAHLV